jgi:hypothetical protein
MIPSAFAQILRPGFKNVFCGHENYVSICHMRNERYAELIVGFSHLCCERGKMIEELNKEDRKTSESYKDRMIQRKVQR